MNANLKILTAGVLFFTGQFLSAQQTKSDSLSKEKERDIEEVVVVGYQKKAKKEITTSVSNISSKDMNNTPITSFDQILAGKAAGVDLGIGSGQPGAANTSIVMRGAGSINGGTTPLYIVDGIPVVAQAFASINPNDIENISLLKDAAAKSIYGSQAGGGVVLVTTKSGRKGAMRVQYTGSIGVSIRPQSKFNMMNTAQITGMQRDLGLINQATYEQRNLVNTEWDKVFIKPGIMMSNDISISGGAGNTTYLVSLGHLDQKGLSKGTGLQRFTSNINLRTGNGKNFRIGFNGIFAFSKRDALTVEGAVNMRNPFTAAYLAMPYHKLYNNDGSLAIGGGRFGANAYEYMLSAQNQRQETKVTSGIFAEYDITKKLMARVSSGIDYSGRFIKTFMDPNTFYGKTITPGKLGRLDRDYHRFVGLNNNASLVYQNNFGNHNLKALALAEYTGKFIDMMGYQGFGLESLIGNNPNSIKITKDLLPKISGTERQATILSYLASVDYNYGGKYFISANIRRDGSSIFSKDYKWGTFGGASIGWAINQENFLKDSKHVNDLKLRASWGVLGNSGNLMDIDRALYNQERYMASSLYNDEVTLVPSGPYNSEYRWEKEEQINIGLDFGFFRNRLTGSVDVYDRITKDLYINKSLSRTTGFKELENYNGGKMRNRGIEVSLNYDIIKNHNTRLSFNTNFAYNKNKILDLGEVTEYELGTSIVKVGLPLGSHYVVEWGGVDPNDGTPIYLDRNGNRMPVSVDKNGEKTAEFKGAEAQAKYGSFYAPYIGGFGLDFNYKGFFVSGQFQWKAKYYRFNNMRFFNEDAQKITNYNQYATVLDYWKNPGQVTDIQSPKYGLEFTSKFIEDSSFLRLRNVKVGYNFSKDLLANSGLKEVSVFLNATNLFTWTKWTGLDPDDNNNVSSYEYPSPRTFSLGATLTF